MGPKAEFLEMARGLMDSFPSITVDLYALAYWLQAWSEDTAHKAQEESNGK